MKNYLAKTDPASYSKYLDRVRSAVDEAKQISDTIISSNNFETADWRRLRVKIRHLNACRDLLTEMNGFETKNRTLQKLSALLEETSSVRDEQAFWDSIPKKYRTSELRRSLSVPSLVSSCSQQALLKHVKETFNSKFVHALDHSVVEPLKAFSETKFRHVTNRIIKKKSRVLKSMASKVNHAKVDSKLLHKFRIRSKKLRYLLKLVNPELKPKSRLLEPVIEDNQNAFGRLHDINNAIVIVKSAGSKSRNTSEKRLIADLKKDRREALKLALEKANVLRSLL
jgi:CHAD domain-containing protein